MGMIRTLLLAYIALGAALTLCGTASAVNVVVNDLAVGQTPELIGYNSGHFMPGSNTTDWWRYSGVNAARVWSTPSVVEGDDDNSVWGDGVRTASQFESRRNALRNDPLNPSFINWSHFENNFANATTSGNVMKLDHAFDELRSLDITSLAVVHRSSGAYPFSPAGTTAGWQDRWEHWQHFYAQAFHLARRHDVERFQMYNEPNHSSQSVSQAEYLERLQFASDAIQSAVADVNALYGKSLTPHVQGPVTAGGLSKFLADPGGEPRDDQTGWGELVIDDINTTYSGVVDPNFQVIDTYAYQQYNKTGEGFGSDLAQIRTLLNSSPSSEDLRIAITEFNVHTASVFGGLSETLDSPSKFSRMGSIFASLANNEPDELYVFKFSQTDNQGDGNIKKNGVHYVDNNDQPRNIGGMTNAGEVLRLFTKGFAGANELLGFQSDADSDLSISVSRDESKTYLLAANESSSATNLNIDLSSLGLPANARIVVEEVSQDRRGEVRSVMSLPSSGVISLAQPAESVLLVSASSTPTNQLTLAATDDAMVKSGGNASTNFGLSANLRAKNDPANAGARNVSYIKFDLEGVDLSSVENAILSVEGENDAAGDDVVAHVYGVLGDDWQEDTITWATAPNLSDGLGVVDDISDNFIEGIGESAFFVGHLTGVDATRELMLDVTDFVQDHPDQEITFLIAREVRFDGENIDDVFSSLRLNSRQAASGGPELLLSLAPPGLEGDYNGDDLVSAADFAVWRDGAADSVQGSYSAWARNLGQGGTTSAIAVTVPEPATRLLAAACMLVGVRRK